MRLTVVYLLALRSQSDGHLLATSYQLTSYLITVTLEIFANLGKDRRTVVGVLSFSFFLPFFCYDVIPLLVHVLLCSFDSACMFVFPLSLIGSWFSAVLEKSFTRHYSAIEEKSIDLLKLGMYWPTFTILTGYEKTGSTH